MITFARIRDFALIRALITAPGSWDAATDDASPPASAFAPNEDERIWYVIASDVQPARGKERESLSKQSSEAGFNEAARETNEDEYTIIGLYTFIPENSVCYEIHVTRAFGARAVAAGRGVVPWFCRESGARRVVASIPVTNPIAVRYAVACGFSEFGRNFRSFMKRGELRDQALLGISPRI
jgi:RimJ/RimL family protein N-acetyltransferase